MTYVYVMKLLDLSPDRQSIYGFLRR